MGSAKKNDIAAAAAICGGPRPAMRFGAVKSPEQQSIMMLYWTWSILIRQRIQTSNAIRRHTVKFRVVGAV
ncbi:hypothetical protein D3C80_2021480 [compost metagenome]